jgi:rhodanese-related sulfurtransferase/rubrerythrin
MAVEEIFPDDAKEFMEGRDEGTYTLLDVRQPAEYEAEHLPGARLVPLPEVPERFRELDPTYPVIVYCAAGPRSRAAAEFLGARGFRTVYNLVGGASGWEGSFAEGPQEQGLELLTGDENPFLIVSLAYRLEAGLGRFYRLAAERSPDKDAAELCIMLASIEERHKNMLVELLNALDAKDEEPGADDPLAGIPKIAVKVEEVIKPEEPDMMEGGFDVEGFLERNEEALGSVQRLLELAMMLETQALDLYLRFAEKSPTDEAKEILYKIADEEKVHLKKLGDLMEEKAR